MQESSPFSVSDFIALANQTLEYAYSNVAIEGEVSSYKVNQGKYVFFDLKDESGSIGCFATVWQMRTPLEDGMRVIITGTPKLTPWGKFSLTIKAIRPVGEGSLKRSFELLVAKLQKEGLFDAERKRSLPSVPSSIGVISSTQAAGYADFIRILDERWGGIRVEVAHVQVQGASAPEQIIRAIRHFNERAEAPEILVIIRGGGSLDDLAAFNDEPLVRAIAASRIPTITGIGHETDTSLADLVADVRAATPSHAAQIIVPDRNEIIERSRGRVTTALDATRRALRYAAEKIDADRRGAYERIVARSSALESRLHGLGQSLGALNPESVLKRGYGLVRADGAVISDPSGLVQGDPIEVELNKYIVKASIEHVREKNLSQK
jgi:exodeoxyribonuclease VII large subunit